MRCNDCNRFVGYDEQDPEVNDIQIDESGVVTVEVRIANACDQCGTELKEATFNLEADMSAECEGHTQDTIPEPKEGEEPVEHELSVEECSSERTSRSDGKEGTPSRYRRTYYGVRVEFEIHCSCGKLGAMQTHKQKNAAGIEEDVQVFIEGMGGDVEEEIQASDMDELV